MFTGIIAAVGTIGKIETPGADRRIVIDAGKLDLTDMKTGDSICINGVCLTVVELSRNGFAVDVSAETLSCTTFDSLRTGDRVNLEKALRLSDRLGGHLVMGHVDGVGCITGLRRDARSTRYFIEAPLELTPYLCQKGSACVDGVSLTINGVNKNIFDVNIIPHTTDETIFSDYTIGTRVNLEIDVIARYLEKLTGSNQ